MIESAQIIKQKVDALETQRKLLKSFAENKAKAIGDYERAMAITIIQLKNGVEFKVNGNTIVSPPTTIVEKIAKGICYQQKIDMEKADACYRGLIVSIECIKAELNGCQSINRYLSEV